MELTPEQRARLRHLRDIHSGTTYTRDGTRPISDDEYNRKKARLGALRKAWSKIDADTRLQLIVDLNRACDDTSDDAMMPDFDWVIAQYLRDMRLPTGRPAKVPGFREVTIELWDAWRKMYGGHNRLDREARAFLGAELSSLFTIDPTDAADQAYQILKSLDD